MVKILRPKIIMSAEEKQAARANMDGEKLENSKPAIEEQSEASLVPDQQPSVAGEVAPLRPTEAPQHVSSINISKNKRKVAKAAEINQQEEIDTHAVRLTRSIVAQARINVLLLPKGMGIKNMREYGDAALLFYEAHLLKTGKLPDIRQAYKSY